MKKILALISIIALITTFACEKDETKAIITSNVTKPAISSHANGFEKVIAEEDIEEVITFEWSQADYGLNTQVTYYLELDSVGRNFLTGITLGSTTSNTLSMTIGDLNDKLLEELNVSANEVSTFDLRVTSSLNNQHLNSSEIINLKITTWKYIAPEPELPLSLWVPGAYQGWDPSVAPTIATTDENLFEGYVYMNVGDYYKFTSSPDWNHINYGDAGTPGQLTTDGLAGGLKVESAGYYKFNVDVSNLTYEALFVSTWGLIGTATSGGWDGSTPMEYEVENDVWTATVSLASGALKFRANDGWDLNYGPADIHSLEGTLIQTNDAINIAEEGNYTIILDFSKSEKPYEYTYSVVKNN